MNLWKNGTLEHITIKDAAVALTWLPYSCRRSAAVAGQLQLQVSCSCRRSAAVAGGQITRSLRAAVITESKTWKSAAEVTTTTASTTHTPHNCQHNTHSTQLPAQHTLHTTASTRHTASQSSSQCSPADKYKAVCEPPCTSIQFLDARPRLQIPGRQTPTPDSWTPDSDSRFLDARLRLQILSVTARAS
ncbi:hypothetical protein FHG87_013150 [Trinorchestia longiramus]|nr:hypothetical protein FHG87_013150 [Trinorchestia longiramus]